MSDERIIHLNEKAIKGELKEFVRNSVEETLNSLLDQEAEALTNAESMSEQRTTKDTDPGAMNEAF